MAANYDWLDRALGLTEHARHGGDSVAGKDRLAVYFRQPGHAEAFLAAHPWLERADGTAASWYTSPHLPFGAARRSSPCATSTTL